MLSKEEIESMKIGLWNIRADNLKTMQCSLADTSDKKEWQKEINSCGYTWLYDWTLAFIPETKFNQIERCSNIEIYYEEATIEECIERLSPTEYNEMYGNILKVVKNND